MPVTSKGLTLAAIMTAHPKEWLMLSRQQQVFVADYVSNGKAQGHYDAVAAARVAYPQVKFIKVWAGRLMANKQVKKVLALHFGFTEAEVLLADIKSLIKRSRRKGASLDILVAPWLRASAALEAFVAAEKSRGN
jgi:hypothetical protein